MAGVITTEPPGKPTVHVSWSHRGRQVPESSSGLFPASESTGQVTKLLLVKATVTVFFLLIFPSSPFLPALPPSPEVPSFLLNTPCHRESILGHKVRTVIGRSPALTVTHEHQNHRDSCFRPCNPGMSCEGRQYCSCGSGSERLLMLSMAVDTSHRMTA